MTSSKSSRQMSTSIMKGQQMQSHPRILRQPCFTLKRPLVFQLRKSLVDYVDEELLNMDTSVFYQRIFVLAKNVEIKNPSIISVTASQKGVVTEAAASLDGDAATVRPSDIMAGDKDQHYSQNSTIDGDQLKDDDDADAPGITYAQDSSVETVTKLFTFHEVIAEEKEDQVPPQEALPAQTEPMEPPKDAFTIFTEKVEELHKKCRNLTYSTDPLCGLFIYMNEYTMVMLESGEDMLNIFCSELLNIVDEFWSSNRVFLMEDYVKELYMKELVFRRIPAVFLNEKFPPSTPTDEYLMGKQHMIIKEKLNTICTLISESLEPIMPAESSDTGPINSSEALMPTEVTDLDTYVETEGLEEESQPVTRATLTRHQRMTVADSDVLPLEIFRKLMPEIQRIELVLSCTRFYFTLEEFNALYGKTPFRRDNESLFWPVQNNYTPMNILRRTPFDINLTFAEYAAEMAQRMQEEQEKHKAEQEAAAAAEANAAQEAQQQEQARHPTAKASEKEEND